MDRFSQDCKGFALTMSLKKTCSETWYRSTAGHHHHRRLWTLCCLTVHLDIITSVPPSLTTSPWAQRSTRGLGRYLQLSHVSRLECGQSPSCWWRHRWQSRDSTDKGPCNWPREVGPTLNQHFETRGKNIIYWRQQQTSWHTERSAVIPT